jgi:hypothetical protein
VTNPDATADDIGERSTQKRALVAGGMDLGPLHFETGPGQFDLGGFVWTANGCREMNPCGGN